MSESTDRAGEPLLEIRGVHKAYGSREVLRGVDVMLGERETLVIIGPSGGGKSTLLRTIAGLEAIDAGEIRLDGTVLQGSAEAASGRRRRDVRAVQRDVGMIFQQFNLFPHKSVLDNVVLALRLVRGLESSEAVRRAEEELEHVGLLDHARQYPDELSGGQQQRVAIARALAMRPRIMLFDEPTSALDPELIGSVLATMRRLSAEGMTMVVVTHEMSFARDAADRVAFVADGVVVEEGPPRQLLEAPTAERTRTFLQRLLAH